MASSVAISSKRLLTRAIILLSLMAHPELHELLAKLRTIHEALLHYQPLALSPPVLDSASADDKEEDAAWLKTEGVPGVKKLREAVKYDIDTLQRFLSDPKSDTEQPISTHAPYLMAVYNEILCAPPPVISVFKFVPHVVAGPKEQNAPLKTDAAVPSALPGDGKKSSVAQRRAAAKEKGPPAKVPTEDSTKTPGKHVPTTKVDIVAENGKRWIRINTIKMSGITAELREIDSYLTDSSSDSDDPDHRPSLAQKEFDNTILQMGRALMTAAKAHPVDGRVPRVTMRLTRLDVSPFREDSTPNDPRIAQTVQTLQNMGLDVELGERNENEVPAIHQSSPKPLSPISPTRQINLDLSVLVALVSDLTHAPLPTSVEEATARFLPPQRYRDWRPQSGDDDTKRDHPEQPSEDFLRHSRALTMHVLQEMKRGFLQEIHDHLPAAKGDSGDEVEFWTSDEAKERCLRIVSRIGGPREIRRAEALFAGPEVPREQAEELFWAESRYPKAFIPIFPIRMYPAPSRGEVPLQGAPEPHGWFFQVLSRVCRELLGQSQAAEPADDEDHAQMPVPSSLSKTTSRLSPHAVKSMLRGAELGWTTLTTTKSSVKALLREVCVARLNGRLAELEAASLDDEQGVKAALWIVDPRNLQCFL
uniref:DUF1308 domain-containing protein n=1 Tax=Mycena chlorophos TaxID=658473 RepID=A0ABQ0KVU9_MYCCL|nr:predicted protein [Mycena chlorophos]